MSFSIHKLTKLIVIPLQLSNLSKFNESSVDPDEQAHSVASNAVYIVGNDCFLSDAMHKWVKFTISSFQEGLEIIPSFKYYIAKILKR